MSLLFNFSKSGEREENDMTARATKNEHYGLVFAFMEKLKKSCHKSYYFVACQFLSEEAKRSSEEAKHMVSLSLGMCFLACILSD